MTASRQVPGNIPVQEFDHQMHRFLDQHHFVTKSTTYGKKIIWRNFMS